MRSAGGDPGRRARILKQGFHAVTSNWEWTTRRRRLLRRWYPIGPILLVTAGLVLGGFMVSPWPPIATIKHLLASPNCAAARAVGLAPAQAGQPGFYARHDADDDGIACEPWPPLRD
ncbi:excalibur calcium-binding domain-containing protein [Inquilinus ginsengisoli]|uniref:excalibur calcium-binding domain-containing protein n=1 Tax=Inquilinus ginsengisoli TaxID=363840 RepID=UPI0035B5460D